MVGFWLLAATLIVTVDNQSIDPLVDPKGTIAIVRARDEKVENFRMGGEPFSPKWLYEEEKEGRIEAIYEFQPPFEGEGINIVPPISVKVGEEDLKSPARSYSLDFVEPKEGLTLKAFIYGEEPFYPGKRLQFVYKVYYRGEIALTKEELPLLHAEGFKKIGELEVEDSSFKGYQVRVIRQRVETEKPGVFSFGASVMQGVLDGKEQVMAKVEPFTLEVLPFPTESAPPSFTGALGEWEIEAKLLSESDVERGERILLEVTLRGEGNLEPLTLPSVFCMPGFQGFFTPTGNPVVAKEGKGEKKFYIELLPMTAEVVSIPPVQFTSFLAGSGKYQTVQSKPILLRVNGGKTVPSFPTYKFLPAPIDWSEVEIVQRVPSPLPLEGVGPRFGWLLWLLPLLLPLQYLLKMRGEKRKKEWKRRQALKSAGSYEIEEPPFLLHLREALEGLEGDEVFSLVNRVKYGGEKIPKKAILEKAWASIS